MELSTTLVSDALDLLHLEGGCLGITPVVSGTKMVGPAFTVKYGPIGLEKRTASHFLDDVPAGGVVVIDNAGCTSCTVWGDIMTKLAIRNGLAGTVIDGVCRDVEIIRELGYPIFTRGAYMVTGKGRRQEQYVQQPVDISNILVTPGDLMVADDNGVVVVPQQYIEEVLKKAQEIDAMENRIEGFLKEGLTLKEARIKEGYFKVGRQN